MADDYGVSPKEMASQLLEAQAEEFNVGQEGTLRAAKTFSEMSGRERRDTLRRTPFLRKLLGPPAEERETMIEVPVSPGDLARQAIRATQLPPAAQEAIVGVAQHATKDLPPSVRGVTTGLAEAAAGLPVIPGLPPVAGRVVAGGFAGELTAHLPEAVEDLQAAIAEGDSERIAHSATGLGTQVAFAVLAGRHAVKSPVKPSAGETLARELERAEMVEVGQGAPRPPLVEDVGSRGATSPTSEGVHPALRYALERQLRAAVPARSALAEAPAEPATSQGIPTQSPQPARPGFVRMYHGGADPTGKLNGPRDITPDPEYAKGYADKSAAKVWYVDVPENAPYMKKAFEEFEGGPKSPWINTTAPAEIMKSAKPLGRRAIALDDVAAIEAEAEAQAQRRAPSAGPGANVTLPPEPLIVPETIKESLQVQPERAVSEPAVAGAETITGPEVRTGTAMPAEREERPTPPLSQRKQRAPLDRPWDIIDEIEGSVGGKIDPALIREADPHWRPEGAARALFRRGGRGADRVLNDITYDGPKLGLAQDTPLGDFGHALNAAARARQEYRRRSSAAALTREQSGERRAAGQDAQFTAKVLQGERPKAEQSNVERVEVGGLVEGDTFKVQNHEFSVERIGFDEDGRATSVTLKDGPKFGIHKIGADEFIHIDKASLKTVPREAAAEPFSFAPPESVAEQAARLDAESKVKAARDLEASQRQRMMEQAARPLGGDLGSAGQGGLFAEPGQQEIFRPPAPQKKPGLIADTATEAWADRTIAEGQKRVSTGLDPELLAAYVVKGAALLERGTRRFADWSQKMIAEYGDVIRPHLRAIWGEAQASFKELQARTPSPQPSPPVGERVSGAQRPGSLSPIGGEGQGEGARLRKLASRATTSPDVLTAQQAAIPADPGMYYERQRQLTVADRIGRMSSDELAAVPFVQPDGTENIWVASRLELYKRLNAAGQSDAAYAVLRDAAQRGTALGQLVNQFKFLRGATPEGVVDMVEQRVTENGLPPLSPKDRIAVHRGAEESIQRNQEAKQREREWETAPTDENFDAVYDARKQAIEADRQLQERIRRINPASFWDLLTTVQQGNKLTTISQGRNVIGNLSTLWMRAPARGVAAVVDAVDSFVRNRPRQVIAAPHHTIPAALEAAGRAIPQSGKILINGATDFELSKADAHVGLRPLKALKSLFAGELRGKPVSYSAALALEASPFSWIPAASLRLLAAADLPSREAARGRLVAEELKLREKRSNGAFQATQKIISQAIRIPELFFDEPTLERLNREAAGAVFNQPNKLTSALLRGIQSLPGPARFAIRLGLPFIKTPANIIREVYSFTPLNLVGAIHAASKGDIRGAEQAIGRVIVGSMVLAAGNWLYQKGLLGPPLDADDEQQKGRILSGQVLPPGHINLSGLQRELSGESGVWQEGDRTADVVTLGIGGALLWNVASARRAMEKHPEAGNGVEFAAEIVKDSTLATLGYAVNQSFLKGTADALDAIANQKFDQWFQGYAGSLLDVATPRQLENIARSMRQNVPVVAGDSNVKTLENVLRARLGAFGFADTLPLKRDLWGRPIRETPTGALPWVHQNFDVSKTRTIADDPVNLALYSLWRQTADPRVLPTPPDANYIFQRERFTLTKEQIGRLQELTGSARRRLAERVVLAPGFQRASTEGQIAMLQAAYEYGAKVGNMRFGFERHGQLQERQKPAGFK